MSSVRIAATLNEKKSILSASTLAEWDDIYLTLLHE
jgi:hypothetical protein